MGSQKGAESLLGATRIVLTIGEYRRARARSPLVGSWTFHPAGFAYFRPMTDWQAESYAALGQGRTPSPAIYVVAARYGRFRPVFSGLPNPYPQKKVYSTKNPK